jgi:hypothetical protein
MYMCDLCDLLLSLGCSAVVPHYQNTGATVVDSVIKSTTSRRVRSSNPEAPNHAGQKAMAETSEFLEWRDHESGNKGDLSCHSVGVSAK